MLSSPNHQPLLAVHTQSLVPLAGKAGMAAVSPLFQLQ